MTGMGGCRGGEEGSGNSQHVECVKSFSPELFLLHVNEHCGVRCGFCFLGFFLPRTKSLILCVL